MDTPPKPKKYTSPIDVLKDIESGAIFKPTVVSYEVPKTTVPVGGGQFERIDKPRTIERLVQPKSRGIEFIDEPNGGGVEFIDSVLPKAKGLLPEIKTGARAVMGGLPEMAAYAGIKGKQFLEWLTDPLKKKEEALLAKGADMASYPESDILKEAQATGKVPYPKIVSRTAAQTLGEITPKPMDLIAMAGTGALSKFLKPVAKVGQEAISAIPSISRAGVASEVSAGEAILPRAMSPLPPISGKKPLKFIETIKESPVTKPGLVEELAKRDTATESITNLATKQKAMDFVNSDPQKAMAFVYEKAEQTADHTATAIELIKKYQNEGQHSLAGDIAEHAATRLKQAGQTVQAARMYEYLSPESTLIRAQKLIKEANKTKWAWQKDMKLTEDTAKQLFELTKQMQSATGEAKTELAEQVGAVLNGLTRVSMGKKLSTMQTMAQLLNPKTILVRNPLGNELFYRLERLKKFTVDTPIDIVRSTLTGGDRTVTFKTVNQGEFWKNFMRGAKAGWKGINPSGVGTQYDIQAPAFRGKYNPMTYLEKTMGATLKGFDYAAYMRAKNQTVGELSYLKALNEGHAGETLTATAKKYAANADERIQQIADQYGKYITFQDDNVISKGFGTLKRGLNFGKDFGLGDMVLKYPRTPGALLARGLEYSPAGFVKSAYEIAMPILKGTKGNTREVTEGLSRAITGTLGLTGMGYYLADKGIITGSRDKDKDVAALKKSMGGGQYKVNLSALTRWVKSGFKDSETDLRPTDKLYSYDWAQPVAMSLSIGANMNQAKNEAVGKQTKLGRFSGIPGTAVSSLGGAVETLTEQPLVSGVKRLFGGYSPVESVKSVLADIPTSFTPTFLNQIRQKSDPVSRETYNPDKFKEIVNRVKNRLPITSKDLPVKYDTLGRPIQTFQNPSIFNIFLNPGFVSSYRPTESAKMVLDLYKETGDAKIFPRVAPKVLQMYGKRFELDNQQISDMQQKIGTMTDTVFTRLSQMGNFSNAPNDTKAQLLNNFLGKIYDRVKYNTLTNDQKSELLLSMNPKQKKDLAGKIR